MPKPKLAILIKDGCLSSVHSDMDMEVIIQDMDILEDDDGREEVFDDGTLLSDFIDHSNEIA